MEGYTAMYPHGQPGLPDDPVTAYVNNPGLRRLGGHEPCGSVIPHGNALCVLNVK
jgi:hypothetical protein